jgi:hypothetical protein
MFLRVLFWGIIMIILDIAVFPILSNYTLWTDFSFFYFLVLLLSMEDYAFVMALILSSLKAIFLLPDQILLYTSLVLGCLFLVHIFRKTLSFVRFSWEMIWGLAFVVLQMIWLRRFGLSELFASILYHSAFWLFLFPLFYNYFERKLKLIALKRGSAV